MKFGGINKAVIIELGVVCMIICDVNVWDSTVSSPITQHILILKNAQ